MIVDGKKIAEEVFTRLTTSRPRTLGILVGGSNPVTDSFVRIKERAAVRLDVSLVREILSPNATTEDAITALTSLAGKVDGVIVQLPLPKDIDLNPVLAAIPPQKDVDGISAAPLVRPPVAEAIAEVLSQFKVEVKGKHAVVVGSGRLVGMPATALLAMLGADVHVLTLGDSLLPLKNADIVVLGAGEPSLVKPDDIKDGVVLIDAGTSEIGGKVAGDADPACAQKASVFTPVPGGVGPIAVAMIFKNLFTLSRENGI